MAKALILRESYRLAFLGCLTLCAHLGFAAEPMPFDYSSLTHSVNLTALRAGQHDPSGVNNYFFTATMRTLINTPEENKLAADKRRSKSVELGTFGEVELPSLSIWKTPEKAAAAPTSAPTDGAPLHITGDEIRKIVATTMAEFNVKEEMIEVEVDIVMFEKGKRFYFFGEDQKLTSATYLPLPVAGLAAKPPVDQVLKLSDDKGATVTLAVQFEKPKQP